ncbi:MAG: glycosyltransferase [Solirubrobacteraceae bacterium]
MRVAIAALGTRGDVVPYVVLGRGLRAAGHEVLVSTMQGYQGLVEDASLSFHALPGDPSDVFGAGRIDVSRWRPLHHLRVVHAAVHALVSQTDPAPLLDAWAGRELVVFTGSTTFADPVARRLGARRAMVVMTPAVATGAFAHPVLTPGLAAGAHGNLASWLVGERLARQSFKEPLKPAARLAWRLPPSALGARRRDATWPPVPLLHAYSAEVVARPPDWPRHVTVTGWLAPEPSREQLPERVQRFLAGGEAPIYVGFGSMPVPAGDRDRVASLLLAALRRTGQRAIVCGSALADAPVLLAADGVLTAPELPHERLFERVRAVVHHGGSGTVGAGLRAGLPTLVTPFVFDQFFWGQRVRRLGAGPAPLPFRSLSSRRLAGRLAQLASGRYDAAAARLGERIRAHDSVACAVRELEGIATRTD